MNGIILIIVQNGTWCNFSKMADFCPRDIFPSIAVMHVWISFCVRSSHGELFSGCTADLTNLPLCKYYNWKHSAETSTVCRVCEMLTVCCCSDCCSQYDMTVAMLLWVDFKLRSWIRVCASTWAGVSRRPLCLMRYLPKMMSRQSRMKTITATTPPITAWSTPEGLDMAVGSWEDGTVGWRDKRRDYFGKWNESRNIRILIGFNF